MTLAFRRIPVDAIPFATYDAWLKAIVCIDCKITHAATGRRWASEVQCFQCWALNGPPEKRGLPSALDTFTEWSAAQ